MLPVEDGLFAAIGLPMSALVFAELFVISAEATVELFEIVVTLLTIDCVAFWATGWDARVELPDIVVATLVLVCVEF